MPLLDGLALLLDRPAEGLRQAAIDIARKHRKLQIRAGKLLKVIDHGVALTGRGIGVWPCCQASIAILQREAHEALLAVGICDRLIVR